MSHGLFPLGTATGAAFCNRVGERRRLASHITHGRHTLLSAPRRYGKTSLVLQVMEELQDQGVTMCSVDLFLAYDMASAQRLILTGVGQLITRIVPVQKRAMALMKDFFSSLRPELTLSNQGFQVRFAPEATGPDSIQAALTGLDQAATQRNVRAVLVLDEFQQLGTLRESAALEAAIRHAAERTRSLTYVFSGSSRHLLEQMFDDRSRPLYHLCERLALQRIGSEDYTPFLQQAAESRWQQLLDNATAARILQLTEHHPYYVNLLCSRLWDEEHPPDPDTVQSTWTEYVEEERNRLVNELVDLSANQRGVLVALAVEPTAQPHSQQFLSRVRMATGSVARALAVLKERDLVFTDGEDRLRVLDPAIAYYLRTTYKA